eukprot:12053330-Karenia_brevis.AAC.1
MLAAPFNAFGQKFKGRGYEDFGAESDKEYFLSLAVWGMGNLNSVDFAQHLHLEVLRSEGCMSDEC